MMPSNNEMEPILLDLPIDYNTERLILRRYNPGDGEEYYKILQANYSHLEEEASEIKEVTTMEKTEVWCRKRMVEWMERKRFVALIIEKKSSEIIGQIWIEPLNWEIKIFGIGYFVVKNLEGHGFITEAVKGSLDFLFTAVKANKVEIHTKVSNSRSIAVADRCGFTKEAHLRDRVADNQGNIGDLVYYGLLKNEYLKSA